ncbi:MAG: 50S ribosomal protein L9 [Planctomycetes bacterium]|nr:50S ribosomal protein L9 [Planctomycetota bacterium]MCC7171522.1 50S ribosomal protein L9 [Planctomycetota bacterium]
MQQVILVQDVDTIGRRGLVVRVKDGFARNYLLPRKIAVLATSDNLKRLEGLRKKYEEEEKERKAAATSAINKLQGLTLTISAKVSDEGHLYGSVNVATIQELLAKQGHTIDSKAIRLAEPIKEPGVHSVAIVIHEEARTDIKVAVVKEVDAQPAEG